MDRSAKIVVALLVCAAVGFFIFTKLENWHKNKVETAVTQEQQAWKEKTDQLEQKVASLQNELGTVKGQNVPAQKLAEVFGDGKSPEIQDEAEKLAEVEDAVKKLARVVKDEKVLAALLGDEKKLAQAVGDNTKLLTVMREEDKLAGILRDEKKLTAIVRNEKKLAEIVAEESKSGVQEAEAEKLAEVEDEVKKLARGVKDEKVLAALLRDEKKLAQALDNETKLLTVMREENKLAGILRDEKKLTAIVHDEKKLAELVAEEGKSGVQEEGVVRKKISDSKTQPDPADIEHRIKAFFTYLDEQPYVQAYSLEGGTYLQYQVAIDKLSSNLPAITGEMQSLYTMVRNVAHLYRVMGKKPIHLTREILQNESEVIEPVMATFNRWYAMNDGGGSSLGGRPSAETMYDYAGFLLNTLGGRSYLLRRSPKIRVLITYYCVLALDRANDEGLNINGIDIRPYIKTSLMEVKNQIGLIYQKDYIAKLSELSLKYSP